MSFPQDKPDLFALYFKLQEMTEPPVIFHRWSLITSLSAYLGRQFWLPFGQKRFFPNFYTMLIGHPGARKSTAIKLGKKLLSASGYDTFAAEKTSKEKFLLDLEGLTEDELNSTIGSRRKKSLKGLTSEELMESLFGKDKDKEIKSAKEVFIVADEFNEFVGSGNLEFLSLLGMLWDWDDESSDYQFRLKNSKSVSIYQPTITILSGNTHAGFVEAFPPQAIGQGFLSRIILVYGEPSGKKIAFPPDPPEELKKQIIEYLQEIKQKVVGPATFTEDARRACSLIYNNWKDLEDGRFKHYSSRRYDHLLKLCLVCAAAKCSTEITEQTVILANSILSFTENDMPKALGEFGKSKDAEVSGKIMQALYEAKEPMTTSMILKIVKNDLDKMQQLGEIMMKLCNADQAQLVHGKGYLPKQRILNARQLYVDFTLLKEWQMKFGDGLRRVK